MFEKVSPLHIDKVADRIAGAMVDLAYEKQESPKVAIEVLIGHNECHIIAETSYEFTYDEVKSIVDRITYPIHFNVDLKVVPQDKHLAENQRESLRCGDNGIFRGVKLSEEERLLSNLARFIWDKIIKSDGKYLISDDYITICQSGVNRNYLISLVCDYLKNYDYLYSVNPLGEWENDLNNDTGVTGRKLGSDLGRGATGGAICGKDLSKADVSVNIFLHLLLNMPNTLYAFASSELQEELNYAHFEKLSKLPSIEATCNIGDESVYILGNPFHFRNIVDVVKKYIDIKVGGFEKLAEWGLV